MRIEQLADRKKREIEVGRRFIEEYNRRGGSCFALDESYWDSELDPAPDLRFINSTRSVFAEVVSFDEAGQEGFVRSAATGRLLTAIEHALDSAGAEGFNVMVEPADPRRVPHRQELAAYAYSLTEYCLAKVKLLEKQRYQWDAQHEQAWKFVLANLRDLDISLSSAKRAHCAVSGGIRMINTVEALREAIQGKGLKRYGPATHLLVDDLGHFVSSAELLELLEGELITVDGYEGVWFVSLREGRVVPLHEPPAAGAVSR